MKNTVKPADESMESLEARMLPKNQRHMVGPEALEDRNTKVEITMHLDLDVLNYFKKLAADKGTTYQDLLNATMREVMDMNRPDDAVSVTMRLLQVRALLEGAIRASKGR